MDGREGISDYFKVLPPHNYGEKQSHGPSWAVANQAAINKELCRDGPAIWYSKIEVVGNSGVFTGPNAIESTAETFFRSFGYTPHDLAKKRILDIGAFSGGMSFFAEDCGADVVAIDIQDPLTNGFSLIHKIRRSTVMHVTASIYDIHPDLFGEFDIILFSGIHYHLKHPLLALERLSAVTKQGGDLLALGTSADFWLHKPGNERAGVNLSRITKAALPKMLTLDDINEIPLLGFYSESYLQDDSNWFIPNTCALADMIGASGFDVLSTGTFPIHRPLIDGPISCSLVKARRARDAKGEYSPEVYSHLRRFDSKSTPSATFSIPTWYELEKERRRHTRR